ncbi:hypothetical protein J4558_22720 [Leptolyngbya sp. 15MV]|nr:hypothetical protein J4558_22720 [Leptolyngbya sp. 15MV]
MVGVLARRHAAEIDLTLPGADAPGRGRIQVGGISGASVHTIITTPDEPVIILTNDGREVASFSLRPELASGPGTQDAPALGDYPALAEAAASALARRLYDPELARSTQVRSYLAQLRGNAERARDDVEFIFGAAVAGRNHLSTSLPLIFKSPGEDSMRLLTAFRAAGDRSPIRVEFDDEQGLAVLRVDAFIDAADVDAAMNAVIAHEPAVRGLVIDLWQTPGVTLASLALLPWLLDAPTEVGQVIGPQQRSAVLSGDSSALDAVDISTAGDIDRLEGLIDLGGGAAIRVVPRPERFTGPVAVVIGRRTTTTAEPLAWTLQRTGRARLFGRPTPGRPLISRPEELGQGWVVWLPAAQWRDTSGQPRPLELGRGVRPSESADRSPAREAARRWVRARFEQADAVEP